MKTVMIRVAPPSAGATDYPVELFIQGDDGEWPEQALASSTIPRQLARPETVGLPPGESMPAAIEKLLVDQATQRTPAFENLGRYLYGLLFAGDVATQWADLMRLYPGTRGTAGRRLLLDIRTADLARLPWELIRSEGPLPLFADELNPCLRVHQLESPSAPSCSPLRRVLVVVGTNDPTVQSDEEIDELHEAFRSEYGLLDLRVLDRPARGEIDELLAEFQPHVFHFIGHGDSLNSDGELLIDPKNGASGYRWDTTSIAGALNRFAPRLAVINACRSQQGAAGRSPDEIAQASRAGNWEIAATFLEAGTQAVVAMQGDIRDDAAVRLTGPLYSAIAEGRPVDSALARARRAVAAGNWDTRDHWLPCLTVSVAPDCVIPPQSALSVSPAQRTEIQGRFKPLKYLVDREEQRGDLVDFLWSTSDGESVGAALAIVGAQEAGKTGLLTWTMGAYALAGANVAYVDLNDTDWLSFRNVLERLENALRNAPIHGSENAKVLDKLVGRVGSDWATRPEADTSAESLFAAFHEALNELPPPVVLGLDHPERVQEAHRTIVREHLIAAAASGSLRARVIVAVNLANGDNILPAQTVAAVRTVEVKLWPPARYRELAIRYLRAFDIPRNVNVDAIVDGLARVRAESAVGWPAGHLPGLVKLLNSASTLSQ